MAVICVSIFTIVLVLLSGIPLISGGTTNYANAKYATNTQTQANEKSVILVPIVPLIRHKRKVMEVLVHRLTYRFPNSMRNKKYLLLRPAYGVVYSLRFRVVN